MLCVQHSTTARPFGLGDAGITGVYKAYITDICDTCACGVAGMHQPCAALQIEPLQGREVAETLRQLNLNVQADGAHAAVCVCAGCVVN